MRPTVWIIKVFVESDDDAVVRAKIDAIEEALCGPEQELGPDHRCAPPWFIVSSRLPKKKANKWRELLNR